MRLGENIAPVAVFVVWWVGVVPITLLLGDVWRQVNPWATLARLVGLPARAARPYRPPSDSGPRSCC